MSNEDKKDVIERLKIHLDRIERLMSMVETPPFGSKKEEARQLMKTVKESLSEDSKLGNTRRGEESLTDFERRFLVPATSGASSQISVRWNSNPDGKWFSELYGAQIDITHTLRQLEKK